MRLIREIVASFVARGVPGFCAATKYSKLDGSVCARPISAIDVARSGDSADVGRLLYRSRWLSGEYASKVSCMTKTNAKRAKAITVTTRDAWAHPRKAMFTISFQFLANKPHTFSLVIACSFQLHIVTVAVFHSARHRARVVWRGKRWTVGDLCKRLNPVFIQRKALFAEGTTDRRLVLSTLWFRIHL